MSEERESVTVVALVAERRLDDARARTASFHHQFNQSLQGPMLDALIRDGDPAK